MYESTIDNTCYNNCENLWPIFYVNKDKNKCFANCSNYILKRNEDEVDILYCLDSCDSMTYNSGGQEIQYYHRYKDNICIENCAVNSDISQYYHIKENNVCYQSCKDFDNNSKYEYNSKCFSSIDSAFNGTLHYTMKSGIIKYRSSTTETDLNFCSKAGFYYIDRNNNECTNCEGYKIPYSFKTNDDRIEQLGECLTTCNTTYPYYNKDDKLCQKSCNHKKIIRVDVLI
jgi:hypothetical protein